MLIGPPGEGVLLDPLPLGVGLQVSLGVGHGLVGVEDDEGVAVVVVLVAGSVGFAAASGKKIECRRRISASVFPKSDSRTQRSAVGE